MSLRQLRNAVLAEIGRCVFDYDCLFLMEQAARRAAKLSVEREEDFLWFADGAANLRRKTRRRIAFQHE